MSRGKSWCCIPISACPMDLRSSPRVRRWTCSAAPPWIGRDRAMAERETILAAGGVTDNEDRLLSADAPLAELQERCGGMIPGVLAVPELLELVQQGGLMGLRLAREFFAFGGEDEPTAFL